MPVDPHPPAHSQPTLQRRTFLKLSAAAALASGAPSAAGKPQPIAPVAPASRGGGGKAKNLIFMVSDGMSFGTLSLADMYRRQHHGHASHWLSLFSKPGVRRGLYETASADSLVTDSAASGSGWGSGHRVHNSVINITPDGTQRMPLLVRAAQSGKATGVVTTTRVTHATPASFIANSPRRDWEGPIAQQLSERPLDVALGGGAKFFIDLLANVPAGLRVARDRAALLGVESGGRLLGLFADSHVPFVLDRPHTVPTLAEMTRAALRRLDENTDGFVLQVEGGRVDHAAHSNDAASLIAEQVAFDDAIAEVLAHLGGRDDTLLILTTDHGNANPGLTVYGKEAREGFDRIAKVTKSFEWIFDQLKPVAPADRARRAPEVVEQVTGIALDTDETRILADALAGRRVAPFRSLAGIDSVLGGLLANHLGIGFVSGNHTADRVEVTAIGPGAENIQPIGHNADLHAVMVAALALAPGELLPDMRDRVEFPKPPAPD